MDAKPRQRLHRNVLVLSIPHSPKLNTRIKHFILLGGDSWTGHLQRGFGNEDLMARPLIEPAMKIPSGSS